MDCFVEAFCCLYDNLPRERMIYPESEKGRAYVQQQQAERAEMIRNNTRFMEKGEGMSNILPSQSEPLPDESGEGSGMPLRYPVMLVILGSGMAVMRVSIVRLTCIVKLLYTIHTFNLQQTELY